jgi:hypothetical protein
MYCKCLGPDSASIKLHSFSRLNLETVDTKNEMKFTNLGALLSTRDGYNNIIATVFILRLLGYTSEIFVDRYIWQSFEGFKAKTTIFSTAKATMIAHQYIKLH